MNKILDNKKSKRLRISGKVISNKMAKTIVVLKKFKKSHLKYKKIIQKSSRFYAHDKDNICKVGDQVIIEETKPLSKLKHWRLVEIIKK